jgi:hypothetical protein
VSDEINPHRRKTVSGVDVDLEVGPILHNEIAIASDTRKNRARAMRRVAIGVFLIWFTRLGAASGLAALGLELWRLFHQ